MKITLQVDGQEVTLSEEQRTAIEAILKKVALVPTEDKWFPVDPQVLLTKEELFQKKWEELPEWERNAQVYDTPCKLILEAFEKVKNNPKKYGRKFKTLMPWKTWDSKTDLELKELACELGDHNADWVEQALEWAQRICNGESWEAICNYPDTANWYRLVVWKSDYNRLVGGSRNHHNNNPASYVLYRLFYSSTRFYYTVPLVVAYDEE